MFMRHAVMPFLVATPGDIILHHYEHDGFRHAATPETREIFTKARRQFEDDMRL